MNYQADFIGFIPSGGESNGDAMPMEGSFF